MMAFVLIKVKTGKERAVLEALHDIKKLHDVYVLLGDFDYIIQVETPDANELGHLVSDAIRKVPGIQKTNTLLVTPTLKS